MNDLRIKIGFKFEVQVQLQVEIQLAKLKEMRRRDERSRYSYYLRILPAIGAIVLTIMLFTSFMRSPSYDITKNPLYIDRTNNKTAKEFYQEFTDMLKDSWTHLRPKHQESLVTEFISKIGVNGILDAMEKDSADPVYECHSKICHHFSPS